MLHEVYPKSGSVSELSRHSSCTIPFAARTWETEIVTRGLSYKHAADMCRMQNCASWNDRNCSPQWALARPRYCSVMCEDTRVHVELTLYLRSKGALERRAEGFELRSEVTDHAVYLGVQSGLIGTFSTLHKVLRGQYSNTTFRGWGRTDWVQDLDEDTRDGRMNQSCNQVRSASSCGGQATPIFPYKVGSTPAAIDQTRFLNSPRGPARRLSGFPLYRKLDCKAAATRSMVLVCFRSIRLTLPHRVSDNLVCCCSIWHGRRLVAAHIHLDTLYVDRTLFAAGRNEREGGHVAVVR